MSQRNKTAPASEDVKVVEEATKYDVAALRRNCVTVLGITTSTFDGAFYEADKNRQYTIDEAKGIIKEWFKKEVK